jgi:hypothetical protein
MKLKSFATVAFILIPSLAYAAGGEEEPAIQGGNGALATPTATSATAIRGPVQRMGTWE